MNAEQNSLDPSEESIIEVSNHIITLFDDLVCRRVGSAVVIIANDYERGIAIPEEAGGSNPEIAKLNEQLQQQERRQKIELLSEKFDISSIAAMLIPSATPTGHHAPAEYTEIDETRDELEQALDDIAYDHDFETAWINREQDILRFRAYLDSNESMGLCLVASKGICKVVVQDDFSTKQQLFEQFESLPLLRPLVSENIYTRLLKNLSTLVAHTKVYLETQIAAYDADTGPSVP